MQIDEKYMVRALELAAHGLGQTSPNPMVGAVIVSEDGRIIGEGYHRHCGEAHAEVNAVASVKDLEALRSSTMYVTLEPCSHYGKTPPCAKLIIDTGIPRVVIGAADPFKEVAGRGVKMLRDAGIEVVEGVLEKDCRSLNARFMTAHEQQRPFITLKWAQSADGFMDSDRPCGKPECFSTPLSSTIVHRLRSLHDAILIGSGTAIADNPRLDCRLWHGRSPRPIILDRRKRIVPSMLRMPVEPLIMHDFSSLNDAFSQMYAKGITSVMVEGGAELLKAIIDNGVWDLAQVETAPRELGEHGCAKAPNFAAPLLASCKLGNNLIRFYSQNSLISVKNP